MILLRLVTLAAMEGDVGNPSFRLSVLDMRLVASVSVGSTFFLIVFFSSPPLPVLVLLVLRFSVFSCRALSVAAAKIDFRLTASTSSSADFILFFLLGEALLASVFATE